MKLSTWFKYSFFIILGVVISGAGCKVKLPIGNSSSSTTAGGCTTEYKPVCGIFEAGEKINFINRCEAERGGAKEILEGTCDNMVESKLRVELPQPNQVIKSPFTVKGKAPGSWFFEGQFPVLVTDRQGVVVGKGIAFSEREWVAESDIEFTGTVSYDLGKSPLRNVADGFVVFQKDNPSGRPENNEEFKVPVKFNVTVACTQEYKPVCGEVQPQCFTTPCDPLRTTYSNRCVAEQAGAQ